MVNNLKITFLLFFVCPAILGQNLTDSTHIQISTDWLGVWKGNMSLVYSNGKSQNIAYQIHISKSDTSQRWFWTIVYGEGKDKQERKYELLAVNSNLGKYAIDEKNSIILDAFFADNTLACHFLVEKNRIMTFYRLENAQLYFENWMVKDENPNKTGKGAKDIPEVLSFPFKVMQRAVLKKNN